MKSASAALKHLCAGGACDRITLMAKLTRHDPRRHRLHSHPQRRSSLGFQTDSQRRMLDPERLRLFLFASREARRAEMGW